MEHFEPGQLDLDRLFEACRVAPRLLITWLVNYRYSERFDNLTIDNLKSSAKDFPASPGSDMEMIAINLPTHKFLKL